MVVRIHCSSHRVVVVQRLSCLAALACTATPVACVRACTLGCLCSPHPCPPRATLLQVKEAVTERDAAKRQLMQLEVRAARV